MSKILIISGVLLILAGIMVKYGLFSWFGKLPGDIKYQGENFIFFAPLTSMILISILLSVIFWIFNR